MQAGLPCNDTAMNGSGIGIHGQEQRLVSCAGNGQRGFNACMTCADNNGIKCLGVHVFDSRDEVPYDVHTMEERR